MTNENHPDPDLGSELRSGAGREWTDDAAEDERLTELHRQRGMDLAARARELANRGDRVSVEAGGHSFSGAVTVAGADYLTVVGAGQVADVRLEAARWSILPLQGSANSGTSTDESFKALLQTYAGRSGVIRLALPGTDLVIGRIAVVAEDHVEVNDVDERKLLVPLKLILAVVRSADAQ